MKLADNIIELNSDIGDNNPSQSAGMKVNRGNYTDVSLFWNEATNTWVAQTAAESTASATDNTILTDGNFTTEITTIDGGSFDT